MVDKPDPRIREIRAVGDIRVFLVRGRDVRDHWFLDFTEGGNDQAYKWMPKNEIWVDDANGAESDFIFLHELHEHSVMRELGLGYERAHQAANEVEHKARRNPDKLPDLLAKEIQRSLKVQKMLAQDHKVVAAYDFSPFATDAGEQGLWKYDRRSGYWDRVRSVTSETAEQWLAIWKRDEPNETFKVSTNRPSGRPREAKDDLATDPPVSEAQRRAMYAAASGHSTLGIPKKVGEEFVGKAHDASLKHASGVLFVAPDGDVLTLRRSGDEANYAGHWALPGGKGEDGESPYQTATREAKEEAGDGIPNGKLKLMDARETPNGLVFFTFAQSVGSKFVPKLNGEHSGYAWAPFDQLPSPLHPGVSSTLSERLLDGKTSADMTPEDWKGLREGFVKWTQEEEKEVEHAADCMGGDCDCAMKGMDGKYQGKTKVEWLAEAKHAHETAEKAVNEGQHASAQPWFNKAEEYRSLAVKAGQALDAPAMDEATVRTRKTQANQIALDRDSVRSYDKDGRLHVALTPISKANICPYYGREIPNSEALGLDPDRVYQLLRDPEELKKAAATFNNLPLLSEHVPVSADTHQPDLVIGSTGTDATYEEPYLKNSLVIWPRKAIDEVESDEIKELSCAYHYDADMTPGTYKGERFDGIMRNIVGNHVAKVKDGRAGSDVVVGDSAMVQKFDFAPFKTARVSFEGFKPDHIAFDAFTETTPKNYRQVTQELASREGVGETKRLMREKAKRVRTVEDTTGTVINKGEPWTHMRTDGKGISKDAVTPEDLQDAAECRKLSQQCEVNARKCYSRATQYRQAGNIEMHRQATKAGSEYNAAALDYSLAAEDFQKGHPTRAELTRDRAERHEDNAESYGVRP